MGYDSQWAHLCRAVFGAGFEPAKLEEQVKAGLQLYSLTAAMLADIILDTDRPLIANTVSLINEAVTVYGD